MDARQVKGLQIAQNGKILKTPNGWVVPSQTGEGAYLVQNVNMKTACDCPDCETRRIKCKHQWAVEYFLQKITDSKGNITVTKAVRMTYPQNWKAYNQAQTSEVAMFDQLLSDLVESVEDPAQFMGRPRLSLRESVFCSIQKVYSQLSSRRAYSLYKNAEEREQIGKAPNYNAVNKLLEREDLAPILYRLLTISALPLKSVETTFIPDSSGFRTSQFGQYAIEKYGIMKKHKWVKAHILIGSKTNVIVSAKIGEEYSADSPQFVPMVMDAHNNGFNIKEICADKAYSSRDNLDIVASFGGTAYIPFRKGVTGKARGSMTWSKMYHYFQLNREEFLQHYHQRSNVESAFNMVKMKFGDRLKSKKWTAQQNELLCKLIAHNIVVLIHEMHELGINPNFDIFKSMRQ
jgi:transposase